MGASTAPFEPNHQPLPAESVKVWAPDGSMGKVENASRGRYRSTFDVKIDKPGTWRIGMENNGIGGTFKVNGEPWMVGRRRGPAPAPGAAPAMTPPSAPPAAPSSSRRARRPQWPTGWASPHRSQPHRGHGRRNPGRRNRPRSDRNHWPQRILRHGGRAERYPVQGHRQGSGIRPPLRCRPTSSQTNPASSASSSMASPLLALKWK